MQLEEGSLLDKNLVIKLRRRVKVGVGKLSQKGLEADSGKHQGSQVDITDGKL